MFRPLKADEIDCRVSTISEKGLSLLLYKDARVDQNILDETFGIFGWQRSHQLIGDRLYCTVSVKNPETGEWISKQDVGTESYTEKEKGQASDSFKRACFNLGIGRELYTAPFIWITPDNYNVKKNQAGKPTTYDRFEVDGIEIKDGKIIYLRIVNVSQKRNVVFESGRQTQTTPTAAPQQTAPAQAAEPADMIGERAAKPLEAMLMKKNVNIEKLLEMKGVKSLSELTTKQYGDIIRSLNKAEDKT